MNPGGAALAHGKVREKRTGSEGLTAAQDELLLPFASLLASLLGTQSFGDVHLRGKRGVSVLLRGRAPELIIFKATQGRICTD